MNVNLARLCMANPHPQTEHRGFREEALNCSRIRLKGFVEIFVKTLF